VSVLSESVVGVLELRFDSHINKATLSVLSLVCVVLDRLLLLLRSAVGIQDLKAVRVQLPSEAHAVDATGDEAGIVIKPGDGSHFVDMLLEGVAFRAVALVETEHLYVVVVCAGKEVASIRKLYFSASLDEEFLVHLKVACTDVHASDLVSEAYNNLES